MLVNWKYLSSKETELITHLVNYHTLWGDDFNKEGSLRKYKQQLKNLIKRGLVIFDKDDDNEGSIDFSANAMKDIRRDQSPAKLQLKKRLELE